MQDSLIIGDKGLQDTLLETGEWMIVDWRQGNAR